MDRRQLERLGGMAAAAMTQAATQAVRSLDRAVPTEARVHLWKAQREILLAVSAVLENQRHPKGSERPERRARKIDLD